MAQAQWNGFVFRPLVANCLGGLHPPFNSWLKEFAELFGDTSQAGKARNVGDVARAIHNIQRHIIGLISHANYYMYLRTYREAAPAHMRNAADMDFLARELMDEEESVEADSREASAKQATPGAAPRHDADAAQSTTKAQPQLTPVTDVSEADATRDEDESAPASQAASSE